MQVSGYAARRVCGFVVPGDWAPSSGLLFSHIIPVGTGYWFHGFFHTLCH